VELCVVKAWVSYCKALYVIYFECFEDRGSGIATPTQKLAVQSALFHVTIAFDYCIFPRSTSGLQD